MALVATLRLLTRLSTDAIEKVGSERNDCGYQDHEGGEVNCNDAR
jgi:hypothetical protein